MPIARRRARLCAPLLAVLAVLAVVLRPVVPASAHGFTSTAYVDLTSGGRGVVLADLTLEYDLLVVSTADAENDDRLFKEGTAAWNGGDLAGQAAALTRHADAVIRYVSDRFTVAAGGHACVPTQVGHVTVELRDVPYAHVMLRYQCGDEAAQEHDVTSSLFPDAEHYVRDTKTIVTYSLDLQSGSAALDGERPSFSTHQSTSARFWDFFRLGAEHLLTGPDHLLFLLALIAGSRRLRELVLAATTFTLAHSVTFILAALGVVAVDADLVEPTIALSIAVVAGWHLWRLWRRGSHAGELETTSTSHLSLDRAGWARLAVVFCFGLVHGLGFAGALGIDSAWSWSLLWSLLVFNLGIEAVQLALIALAFPLLVFARRRNPRAALVITGTIAAAVSVMGLFWFVERVAAG